MFLDDSFEFSSVEVSPGRKGIDVIVAYDEVKEGFDGCVRCWRRRSNAQDMKGVGRLGL